MPYLLIAAVLAVAPALAGEPLCRDARKADVVEAWAMCLSVAKPGKEAERARARLDELAWARATAADSALAYRSYLATVGNGANAKEARVRVEARAYRDAAAAGDPEALDHFLALHPSGLNADQARALLDTRWYERARDLGTQDAWGRYLVRYPRGQYAEDARAARDDLTFAELGDATADGLIRYLSKYPEGRHAEAARERLAALQFTRLGLLVVVRAHWLDGGERRVAQADLRDVARRVGLTALQKRGFGRAELVNLVVDDGSDPRERVPEVAGRGLVVVRLSELQGPSFAPYGFGVKLAADVEVYPPGANEPAARFAVDAQTPELVRGVTVAALHTEGRVQFFTGLAASPGLRAFVPGTRADALK